MHTRLWGAIFVNRRTGREKIVKVAHRHDQQLNGASRRHQGLTHTDHGRRR